jgi:hypothetical protein
MASEENLVRRWLAGKLTGCSFAALFSKPGRLLMATFPSIATTDQIDELFALAGERSLPAIAILPGVRTEVQLAEQLLVLSIGDRWRVQRVPVPTGLDTDDVFVGLEWRTSTPGDLWSSPMGLAPFGTMPQTRRAPYACIAAWTGKRRNQFRKKADRVVHFLDADLGRLRLDPEKYRKHRKASERATTEILVGDRADNYRDVAFRLSAAVSDRLRDLPTLDRT